MKVVKVIVFLGLVIYWIVSMDDKIKGEGIFGSFLGIIVLIAFVYGAFTLFFNNSENKEETKSYKLSAEDEERNRLLVQKKKEEEERMIENLRSESNNAVDNSIIENYLELHEGLRLGNIILNKSNLDDVILEYGKAYKVTVHSEYSVEVIYEKLGLSFYFRLKDKSKTICVITAFFPCKIKTKKGLVLGKHTLKDAEILYGESPFTLTNPQGTDIYSLSLLGDGSGLIVEVPKKNFEVSKKKLKRYYYDDIITKFEIVDHQRKRT